MRTTSSLRPCSAQDGSADHRIVGENQSLAVREMKNPARSSRARGAGPRVGGNARSRDDEFEAVRRQLTGMGRRKAVKRIYSLRPKRALGPRLGAKGSRSRPIDVCGTGEAAKAGEHRVDGIRAGLGTMISIVHCVNRQEWGGVAQGCIPSSPKEPKMKAP
jgi:hypothetical protein